MFLELVPLYFHFIHNIAHTIFHEPSFMQRLRDGRASMIHVYAMCALAARYSTNRVFANVPPSARGRVYATEAIRRCQERMVSPSLETVQGFLLVGYYYSGEGNIRGKHIYVGLSRLHAELLAPEESVGIVLREEYRRTWLSIHIAGHWSASDMAMEPTCPFHDPAPQPEIDDVDFHTLSAELLPETQASPGSRCDMWAQMARTLNIFTKINVLLRRLSRNTTEFRDYCVEAATLENGLDRWADDLPPGLVYDFENLMLLVEKQIGQTFLSMHIGYYHFRQMLFFPFLDARLAGWTTRDRAAKCKESAIIVSDILRYSKTIPGCEMDYFIYGHIAVVSSCVHLHTLLFGDDQVELSLARERLVSNFQFLMSVKSYWSIVDHHVTHLRTFQNSCRDSMADPFVLDNWMARFLTEHSSTLAERQTSNTEQSVPELRAPSVHRGELTGRISATATPYRRMSSATPPTPVGIDIGTPVIDHDLSRLLDDQAMSGEAIVNSALNWLLDGQSEVEQLQ